MNTTRKVQRTPGGTIFVCLPKTWAKRFGVEKGDSLSITESQGGALTIDITAGKEQPLRSVELLPGPYLNREIVSNYLLGFDIISVESKEGSNLDFRRIVKSAVDRLIGLEIVEEDYSRIVLQCLLEPSGFPPEKILRRGYAIAAGMHRDVFSALLDGNVSLAKSIVARDDEADRLYFLLVRILRTIVQNPKLSEKLGVSSIECLDYRLVASLVEAIGDECVRAATKIAEWKGEELTSDLKKAFLNLHTMCYAGHENALQAFLNGDVALAEEVRSSQKKVEESYTGIEKAARAQALDLLPRILSVAGFLLQIFEHSVDMADLAVPKK